MDYSVEEIQPNVWRVRIEGITRIIRYRNGNMTFAPWDVSTAEGRTLWSASSLEAAAMPQTRLYTPAIPARTAAKLIHPVRICRRCAIPPS